MDCREVKSFIVENQSSVLVAIFDIEKTAGKELLVAPGDIYRKGHKQKKMYIVKNLHKKEYIQKKTYTR